MLVFLLLIGVAAGQHCHMPGTGHIRGNEFHGQCYCHSGRWGNALSPYWQGRAMAALGGYDYVINSHMGDHWLKHLPRRVPTLPEKKNFTKFNAACAACPEPHLDWQYPHRCAGVWTEISEAAITDTRKALQAWANEKGRTLPQFDPDDVVIQQRCAGDHILCHNEYGPPAFSFYKNIPPTTKHIFIVRYLEANTPICVQIEAALIAYLKELFPSVPITVMGDDTFTDFTRLVYAPTLFKDASSFGLIAGIANNGTVWSPAQWPNWTFENSHWRWSTAQVLYPDVGRQLGLSVERPSEIIEWLRTH